MNHKPLLKCGHVALATNARGEPSCPICDCVQIAPKIDLTGRIARCTYCGTEKSSDFDLPFFEIGRWEKGVHFEDRDTFYCGCRGWD